MNTKKGGLEASQLVGFVVLSVDYWSRKLIVRL
jgi:hypothetical protein